MLTLFNTFIMATKVGAMFAQKSTLTPEMQLVLDQVRTIDEECTQDGTAIFSIHSYRQKILKHLMETENFLLFRARNVISCMKSEMMYQDVFICTF